MTTAPTTIPPEALLRHTGFVRALARELLGDDGLADDVVQETMLIALQSPPRSTFGLTSWLRRVAYRVALRQVRSSSRRRQREERSAREERLPSVVDELGDAGILRAVGEAVLALREPYRSTVFGRYYEQRSVAELAARAGCPVATVESRLRRGVALLRDRLEAERPGGGWRRSLAALAVPRGESVELGAATVATGAAGTAVTGTLIMSTQMKWSVVAAAAVLGLAATWAARPGADVARGDAEDGIERVTEDADLVSVGPSAIDAGAEGRSDASRTKDVPSAAPEPGIGPAPTTGSLLVDVTYAGGEVATGRTVEILPWDGGNPFADRTTRVTDDRGEALFHDVGAGRVLVTLDLADGGMVEVVAGEENTASFEIPIGVTVRGRVLDPRGGGVAGARIWISDYGVDTEGSCVATSGADGAYVVEHVPSGRRIAAMAEGFDPAHLRQVEGAAGTEAAIDLRLRAGGAVVAGRVLDGDGQPIVGALLRYLPKDPGETSGTDGEPDLGLPAYSAHSADDGSFRIPGLPVGRGRFYARSDGAAPYAETLDLAAGDAVEREVVLRPEVVVHGVVRAADGTAIAGARVMAGDYGAPDFSLVNSAADGRYALDGLPVGSLDVRVEHDDHGTAERTVVAHAGERVEWDPTLDRGLVLKGRVVDGEGEPLAGWYVDVRGERPPPGERVFWLEQRRTDARGAFEVPGCPAYSLQAELRPPQYGANPVAMRRGFLAADGELLFVVDAADLPSARIRGRVEDHAGAEVVGEVRVTRVGGEGRFSLEVPLVEGAFEVGPLPAAQYVLSVDPEDAPRVTLLRPEVAAEATLDVGLLRLPEPCTLRLVTDDDGAFDLLRLEALDGDVSRTWPVGTYADPIDQEIVLWPGSYRVGVRGPGSAPVLADVELVAGERRELEVDAVPGRECAFRAVLPEGEEDAVFLFVSVARDGRRHANWSEANPVEVDYTVRGRIAPGTYTVVARTMDGPKWEGEVTIEAGSGEQLVELPLRR